MKNELVIEYKDTISDVQELVKELKEYRAHGCIFRGQISLWDEDSGRDTAKNQELIPSIFRENDDITKVKDNAFKGVDNNGQLFSAVKGVHDGLGGHLCKILTEISPDKIDEQAALERCYELMKLIITEQAILKKFVDLTNKVKLNIPNSEDVLSFFKNPNVARPIKIITPETGAAAFQDGSLLLCGRNMQQGYG